MAETDITERIVAEMDDPERWKGLLDQNRDLLTGQVIVRLKELADHEVRANLQKALGLADILLYAATLTQNPEHLALAKLASANIEMLGLAHYERAISLYDEAAALYEAVGKPVEQARCQIGKLWALDNVGRHDEAIETGRWASQVLEEHKERLLVARITQQMGILSGRHGDDEQALQSFNRARDLYKDLGPQHKADQARSEYNRAIVLRNLGKFDEAIQSSHAALDLLRGMGQPMDDLRARQTLALTYLVQGHYNQALTLLQDVADAFRADERQRDALVAELFITDCLLAMGRVKDGLERVQHIRTSFAERGLVLEEAQAMVNEAIAYTRLGRHTRKAREILEDARQRFEQTHNAPWVAISQLEMAAVLHSEGKFVESLAAAQQSVETFIAHAMPYQAGRGQLAAGWAALGLGDYDLTARLVQDALASQEVQQSPSLLFLGYYLQGRLAKARGRPEEALQKCDQALEELERLRGRLMVEMRADFLADKEAAYMDAVALCLDLNRFDKALEYAERAKSRALLDLITYRLDLSIRARSPKDEPLVEELKRLRERRDQLYRRWESDEDIRGSRWNRVDQATVQIEHDLVELEKQIEERWRRLLIRDESYSHERQTWQVTTESARPHLDGDTLLIEYFAIHGQLIVFLITQESIHLRQLHTDLAQTRQLAEQLWRNLGKMPRARLRQYAGLAAEALGLLRQLHDSLLRPIADVLPSYERLIIVPHEVLHYVPFHALYDGATYLLERIEVSYLPSSSLMGYCVQQTPGAGSVLVVGHSHGGRLKFAVEEAKGIATLTKGHPLLEEQATKSQFLAQAAHSRVLHVATHVAFRPTNPLFSGLALADGWLTALDVFNLRMTASLVTLSGCETGRSIIAGGDELLGLMRAFLYAGTVSLVLSLWPVEDRSTADLMMDFYRHLYNGQRKGTALRQAQLNAIRPNGTLVHPFFWASFFLVGSTEAL